MDKIILASASPRRQQLLQIAGISFDVMIPGIKEVFLPGRPVEEMAQELAAQKASSIIEKIAGSNRTVLAADTIVALGNRLMGKPSDENEAREMLQQLSGNSHRVITGVCIANANTVVQFSETTIVHFHQLTDEQIEYYIKNHKPFDKAGAYAIQEWIGITGIRRIEGDYYNVMGLPISMVVKELNKMLAAGTGKDQGFFL